ncbi:MAG: glycerophosphoryl diester phosphodiesterase [Bacteriovoracaceae bacterium]|nr:glycerophosphoryl diester phosphodiesterase [Bacteriovoracaceae bacterium]
MLNIAHRGFSSEFPENTMLAFEEAMKAGADGFECDLRITSDGKVVVFHDDDFKRLCGVSGTVETTTWKDLQKLRVKGKEKIPSLHDLLTNFHNTRINLELKKSDRPDALVELVLREMTKIRPKGEILFTSFSVEIVEILGIMDSKRKLGRHGFLVETKNIENLPKTLKTLKPDTWNVPRQIFNRPWAKRWKKVKTPPIWIWTLDEAHEWRQALNLELNVEGIITNKPRALRNFLDLERD